MGATVAVLALAACGTTTGQPDAATDDGWTESPHAVQSGVSPVLYLGDSVAAGQAQALTQGLASSGAKFVDGTSVGGGNVVGPNAEAQWEDLPGTIDEADPSVVIYQLTTYDWGAEDDQLAAYERLADEVADHEAELLMVSMPPIRPDDFYEPRMAELARATDAARAVAEEREGVDFLDASEVWGTEYSRMHDGKIDRSDDGIHTCPQGAARFTQWILGALEERYAGFTPADPEVWANTGWADTDAFRGC